MEKYKYLYNDGLLMRFAYFVELEIYATIGEIYNYKEKSWKLSFSTAEYELAGEGKEISAREAQLITGKEI